MDYTQFTIALILYFVLHSVLAANRVKALFIKQHRAKGSYRLFYNAIAILTTIPLVYFYLQLEATPVFNMGWTGKSLGIVLGLGGLLIIAKALKQYDLREFSGWEIKEQAPNKIPQLVTKGMNAWVRHPLYFGMILLIWGFFFYQTDYRSLILTLIICLYLIIGTRLEEQKLIEEFGEQYLQYRQQVPGLIPWR